MNDRINDDLKRRLDELPREIRPERNLWPGIESALREHDDKVVRPDFEAGSARTGVHWPRLGLLAAAAMLLVTLSSGITAYLVRAPEPVEQPTTTAGPADVQTIAWEQFLEVEHEYQEVTDELLAALEAQRDELSPETVDVVERNLALIDQAIRESRAALERDPANAKLIHKLTDMYRTRVSFLERMSEL